MKVIEELGDENQVPTVPAFWDFFSENGIVYRQITYKPVLSAQNIKKRISFAKNHLKWTVDDWAKIWWSDEVMIEAIPQHKKYKIWCRSGTLIEDMPTAPAVQGGGFRVMFWGSVTKSGLGPLVPIEGMLNSEKYIDILQEYFLPLFQQNQAQMVFMQDNAACHKSRSVTAYLAQNQIQTLEWPPQSPDLNPIENIWYLLKHQLMKYSSFPTSRKDLEARAQKCWRNLGEETVNNILDSMPNRVKKVIEVHGKSIKY